MEKFPPWKTKSRNNEKIEKKTEYLNRQRVSYSEDKIVKGYRYGETSIPVESIYQFVFVVINIFIL